MNTDVRPCPAPELVRQIECTECEGTGRHFHASLNRAWYPGRLPCLVCDGRGWVEIAEEDGE